MSFRPLSPTPGLGQCRGAVLRGQDGGAHIRPPGSSGTDSLRQLVGTFHQHPHGNSSGRNFTPAAV